jgi:hypothetical protein
MNVRYLALVPMLASLLAIGAAPAAPPESRNFVAHLTGAEEVPPRDTDAQGQATFRWNAATGEMRYRLIVADIENVFAAHIHCGPFGANGPVGVTLFMGPVGGGPVDGVLAAGKLTAADAGNACGWPDLAAAVTAMRSGNAYVNVHTNDGVDPPNTGPGDFPGGEIRGQVVKAGPG